MERHVPLMGLKNNAMKESEKYAQELKASIRNAEIRIASCKNMLEEVSRDKIGFPPEDEIVIWYKANLREKKNYEQICLKILIEEKTYENEGMNSPSMYPYKKEKELMKSKYEFRWQTIK